MWECREFGFGVVGSGHAVGKIELVEGKWRSGWSGRRFGGKWYVPEAVGGVAFALDDDFAIFDGVDVVFGKECDAFVVAELTYGYE